MIARPRYLDALTRLRGKDLIKVVTGIRRCGKSTLLELFQAYLRMDGVPDEQIISVNLEDPDYFDIETSKQLYDFIKEKILPDKPMYIFFDEIQRIKDFERIAAGLRARDNCDVYITGSNAYILSGELATYMAGRYIRIKMLPLSFKEYMSALPDNMSAELSKRYGDYTHNSAFPYTLELPGEKERAQYLQDLYDTIVLKDIVSRRKFPDISMLRSVVRFLFPSKAYLNPKSAA